MQKVGWAREEQAGGVGACVDRGIQGRNRRAWRVGVDSKGVVATGPQATYRVEHKTHTTVMHTCTAKRVDFL